MVYGVYANDALVHWAPSKIFGDEISVSFCGLIWCGTRNLLKAVLPIDNRVICSDALFSSSGGISRQWEGQSQGHGK